MSHPYNVVWLHNLNFSRDWFVSSRSKFYLEIVLTFFAEMYLEFGFLKAKSLVLQSKRFGRLPPPRHRSTPVFLILQWASTTGTLHLNNQNKYPDIHHLFQILYSKTRNQKSSFRSWISNSTTTYSLFNTLLKSVWQTKKRPNKALISTRPIKAPISTKNLYFIRNTSAIPFTRSC